MKTKAQKTNKLGNNVLKYHARVPWLTAHYASKDSIEICKQSARNEMNHLIQLMESEIEKCTENSFIYEVDLGPGRKFREGYIGVWLNPIADLVRNLPKNDIGEIIWKNYKSDMNRLGMVGVHPITPLQAFDITFRIN